MALSGLDIYKHLPKTNCKKCGLPTCLAFAMKVATGQAALDACTEISEKGKAALSEASAPPQQLVKIGAGEKAVEIGQETSLFRHEDRFYRPTAIAVRVSDQMGKADLEARCRSAVAARFERMGKKLAIDLIAVQNDSGSPEKFAEAARAAGAASGLPLVLLSAKAECLRAAGKDQAAARPLLWAAAGSAKSGAIDAAKELKLPLCLEGAGFDPVAELSEAARSAGLKDLVLSPGTAGPAAGLEFLAQSRRAAILKKFRPMGYPVAMLALGDDPLQAAVEACWYVLKYAGVVVTDLYRPEHLLSVLTARQDIFTDPQKPVQVEPGVHTVGEPGADSPVLITTNFALSYYSVEPEVESSRVPAYILSVNTEGTSVLTAWAADKFNAKTITGALKASGLEAKVKHRKLVLPGLVAVLSGGVKDESGWDVLVGPKEASGISSFLKNQWRP